MSAYYKRDPGLQEVKKYYGKENFSFHFENYLLILFLKERKFLNKVCIKGQHLVKKGKI